MTNGEKIKETFPNTIIIGCESYIQVMGEKYEFNNTYPLDWWNAEYEEPRKGHWIKGYTFPDGAYWKCDKCNELIKVKFPMNYCNNCGADMREVEE